MPKLRCPCGFVHNLSPIPDDGWITVRDHDYEALVDAERTLHEIAGAGPLPSNDHPRVDEYDAAMGQTLSLRGSLYECPTCGTLLWCKPNSQTFRAFNPAPESQP